jgi:NDP-sugar pyrophosphorylase family protein
MDKKEKVFSNIDVAILAGGLGTRLRPLVEDRQKVMVEINDRPFLEYILDQIKSWGGRRVILCTGYLGNQILSRLGNIYRGVQLIYSEEKAPMGTGGALKMAFHLFHSESVLVINGDSYCKANLMSFLEWHLMKDAMATLLLVESNDTRRYGKVKVDGNGIILKFEEKTESEGPGWINAGFYLFRQGFIKSIPSGRSVSLEREIFRSWIGQGLYGYKSDGQFIDIGTPESYQAAKQFFSENS